MIRNRQPYSFNIISIFAMVTCVLIMMPVFARPDDNFGSFKDVSTEPWHIVADEIRYDDNLHRYIAVGGVTITKKDKKLVADFVHFDQKSMQVLAKGHVMLTSGNDVLTGNRMEMDLNTETGTIYNGTVFFKKNHFYIKGNKIKKISDKSYTADSACFSTCDGPDPSWKITGKNLKVTIEGYGVANHAVLWAKNIPVLYTPFISFPVKLKRQTGLLAPQFGFSDRKGDEYIQPFYWAINQSSDATFYGHHMGKRGEKLGMEYRYVLDDSSKGALMFDFFNDKKLDDGSHNSSKSWGYEDAPTDILRPNSDRYWFRMKHNQGLANDFFLKVDIDVVSDQDYLNEFIDGYTGFDETRDYFNKNFNRDLDEYDDPVRTNRINLSKNWSHYSLNAEMLWYDNVVNRRRESTDTTLQKLPWVEFNGSKQQLFSSLFYYDLDSEYTYFFSQDGKQGHRMDVYPRFYLPYSFNHYFTLEPSVGVRETIWHVEKDDNGLSDSKTLARELFDLKMDLSSEFYNIYDINGKNIDRIKHAVRPQIVYSYTPDLNQSKYPYFDTMDRVEKNNLITYSITNTFTYRSGFKDKKAILLSKNKSGKPYIHRYREFCRFKLEQSYDINEAGEDNPANRANKSKKEPFSPIYGKFEFMPNSYLSIDGDVERSLYRSFYDSHNISVTIRDKRNDSLFIEHRYTHNLNESIYTNLELTVSDRISIYTDYERNKLDGKNIRTGIGFLYKTQCWAAKFSYINEENNKEFAFMINLYGIGGFGQNTSINKMKGSS